MIKTADKNVLETADIYGKISDHIIEKEFTILLADCVAEKRSGQKLLYQVFYQYSLAICLRYADNKDDAVEIMNDGFLKVMRNVRSFTQQHDHIIADFKAWLRQIMIFTAIDYLRKKKRMQLAPIGDDVQMLPMAETQLDHLSYKEIVACIQQLTPAYRAVFSLHVIDGFTHEEIARQLGIAIGTSKSNLAKARIQLQKMLSGDKTNVYEQQAV